MDADKGLCCIKFDCINNCALLLLPVEILLLCFNKTLFVNIEDVFVPVILFEIKAECDCNIADRDNGFDVVTPAVAAVRRVLIVRIFGL
jgi:hypothetical protein